MTAGTGSPSATIDGVEAEDSLAGSIAFSLMTEGVEVEGPTTTQIFVGYPTNICLGPAD
ncbi:hypothetical protein MPLSOD_41111 [Mesorhizobium sp. SOD10]|nr:hypothetical protein MPLSOD_41111 [Mesorhizobium sp. SOD10]